MTTAFAQQSRSRDYTDYRTTHEQTIPQGCCTFPKTLLFYNCRRREVKANFRSFYPVGGRSARPLKQFISEVANQGDHEKVFLDSVVKVFDVLLAPTKLVCEIQAEALP